MIVYYLYQPYILFIMDTRYKYCVFWIPDVNIMFDKTSCIRHDMIKWTGMVFLSAPLYCLTLISNFLRYHHNSRILNLLNSPLSPHFFEYLLALVVLFLHFSLKTSALNPMIRLHVHHIAFLFPAAHHTSALRQRASRSPSSPQHSR